MAKISLVPCLLTLCAILANPSIAQEVPLDQNLKPPHEEGAARAVFKDMAVIQRRAFKKDGRILLSTFSAIDFSDGPYSIYAFHLNPGYAISDFWEVYLSFAPYIANNERPIVGELRNYGISISSDKARMEYGIEVLWAPLYGKDSLGSTRVVRSDTFFKFGLMQVKYDVGTGIKAHGAIGKSYFLGENFAFRPVVSANYVQSTRSGLKAYRFVGMVEAGFVIYL
jgi:hypothetical protein